MPQWKQVNRSTHLTGCCFLEFGPFLPFPASFVSSSALPVPWFCVGGAADEAGDDEDGDSMLVGVWKTPYLTWGFARGSVLFGHFRSDQIRSV